MLTYQEAIDFLYTQTPMFSRVGASAYKPGLETSLHLSELFGNPHQHYRTIHVAGTNGKGSTAHTLAAVLQSAGYRVGLYTSPHLVDFRERMRVDGRMISREAVTDFVERYQAMQMDEKPTFFELTMVMAFEYFAREKVDVAVVEVGLGGRLDSTNIITPVLSVITNISKDHTQFLGDTLVEIAAEKAGIMKPGVPVVIGEAEGDVLRVFEQKASATGTPLILAGESYRPIVNVETDGMGFLYHTSDFGDVRGELRGEYQLRNAATILTALKTLADNGWHITPAAVQEGFAGVSRLTGLAGRWMKVSDDPLVVCDTGHNIGGWEYLAAQLSHHAGRKHMVIGFVNDKDIAAVLRCMARIPDCVYYFTNASIPRALPAPELKAAASEAGLDGEAYSTVAEAYKKALAAVREGDMVFVGGSTFVVADLLAWLAD